MSPLRTWSRLAVTLLALLLPGASRAQQPSSGSYPYPEQQQPREPSDEGTDASTLPADPGALRTRPQAPLTPGDTPVQQQQEPSLTELPAPPAGRDGALLDGRPRQGPFLSGPGSLTFILHHSLMGAAGGFVTQAFPNGFKRGFTQDNLGSREAVLAGTLIGAGLGFGVSAWWQFNHWVDRPLAHFGMGNALVGATTVAGLAYLITGDSDDVIWPAFLGAELGAWLTAAIGGGQLPLSDGLLVASGAGWGLTYGALLLATTHFSGGKIATDTWRKTLLIAPGIGAGAMALASMRYQPTASQILRADIFGAGVGAAVLLLSGLVLGFDQSTPYVLSFLGSAGAIATVSLLWEESVDPSVRPRSLNAVSSRKARPYRNVWW